MAESTLRLRRAAARSDHQPPKPAEAAREPRVEDSGWIDLRGHPADPSLRTALPPEFMIEEGLLPWGRTGAATTVLCAYPRRSVRHLPYLRTMLGGTIRLARTEPGLLAQALHKAAGRPLALEAEALRPRMASCRSLPGPSMAGWAAAGSAAFLGLFVLAPVAVLAALALLASATLLLTAGLRLWQSRPSCATTVPAAARRWCQPGSS